MGVPKFFRYMSERYPCLSEFVKEYQIPEFDNLYLDMNGIIHMCSHPDDGNPHFRITEERIFADIFHYIEVLFRMIKPQKVFFMAVDGVAPRAKMNQQRGRRFRSAKDAEKMELEAKKKGEVLPEEARFDSNCITPGTIFMARLHAQLKYFVVNKVSTDKLWKKCKIILSGHETPGEGEHKIMDYIRYMRSLPGYDPNTRHCLYGLDADLIMLGLCTHDPHFSLLREEVKFGRKASAKRTCVPEEIKFYLLHLSLMREYLELEFAAVKEKLISFEYDIEKIIDDWVLMGFLVGNDFIPHLPNLHITNGALPILYQAYMDILPTLDGYINEGGVLNLDRFEKFMNKLGDIDVQNFEETRDDLLYMEAKTGRKSEPFAKNISRPGKSEVQNVNEVQPAETEKYRDSDLGALIKATEELYFDSSDDTADEDDAFVSYKKYYYINKLDYKKVTPEVMRSQAEGYVRAIQWNLHYYYNGVCSWSWYYPHHYAPYISDIKGFSELKLEFDHGTPFKPYEQLLAVLPAASKNLLPTCYHHLMTDDSSPIKDYYPEDFETDLNGKKQDWEAVVLVPFIDENILLEAMNTCRDYLSPEEVKRNEHGPMLVYTHTQDNLGPYEAPMYFPSVTSNHAKLVALTIDEVRVPINKLVKGAYPGVLLDVYYPGFPTLKHLKYVGRLEKAKVKVFEQCSRNENMLIKILPLEKYSEDKIPVDLLGKIIYVGWPHLIEAKVVSISNSKERYISMGSQGQYNVEASPTTFRQEIDGVAEYYKTRMGIEFGKTKVLVKVQTMIGRRYMFTANGRVNLERDFSQQTSNYPLQSIVDDINVYTKQYAAFTDIESVFPVGSSCFTLSNPFYGAQGIVKEYKDTPSDRVKICISVMKEPDLSPIKRVEESIRKSYRTCYASASQLGMSNQVFSRITGSLFIVTRNRDSELKNVNIGLDLKFNKKNMETPGYTKKTGPTWYYSDKVIDLANSYANQFPEVVQYLAKNNYNNNEDILLEDIFAYQSEERLQSLKEWMKKLPYRNLDKQICGSSVFEPEVVKVIEKIVDDFSNKKEGGFITMKIKPNKLYKPDILIGNVTPDSTADVQLLDRIVNVREGYTVPLGLKGTVTAIHNSPMEFCDDQMFDVVFDSEFAGGLALNCSPGRGYRLPKTAIINISYGLRVYQQKTGKPGELMEAARVGETRSIPKNTYNANRQNNQVYNQNVAQPGSAFAFYGYGNQPCTTQQYRGPPFPVNNNPMMNQYNQNYYQQQHQMPYVLPDNLQGPYIQPNFPQFCVGANSAYKGESAPTNVGKGKEEIKILTRKDNSDFMPQFQKKDDSAELAAQEETINALKKMLKIGICDSDKKTVKHFTSTPHQKKPAHTSKPLEHKQTPKSMKPLENRQPVISIKQKPKDEHVKGVDAAAVVPNSSSNGAHQNVTDLVSSQDASVQLLNFYQSKGLGLPRYEYFSVEGKVQAKIRLPTRQVVIGSPGANREAASEIVAEKALETLNLKELQENDAGHKPEPKNAVVHRQITKKSSGISDVRGPVPMQVNSLSKHHKDNNSKKPSSSKINKTLTNSFVPLQAIKHINKASSAAKTTVKIEDLDINQIDENFKLLQNSERNIVDDKQENARTEKKPRRVRKMRIAANFNMNK